MTIHFVPGEVNNVPQAVAHKKWKNHKVLAYGSGNNLVILTRSYKDDRATEHLQTLYLVGDPGAIAINEKTGYIAIGIGSKIIIYKLVNEYASKINWVSCLEFDTPNDTCVNCLKWAPEESELVCGAENTLLLFHVYDEYGDLKFRQRWSFLQPGHIHTLYVTDNATRIVTTGGFYDNRVKVWSRISYGDQSTNFELSYLLHPASTFVTDLAVRTRYSHLKSSLIDPSMANIQNFRGYIQKEHDYTDIIYTLSNDQKLRIWASYEVNGHTRIRCWKTVDLKLKFKGGDCTNLVALDSIYTKNLKGIENGGSQSSKHIKDTELSDSDIVFCIGQSGQTEIYEINNLTSDPPSAISVIGLESHISTKIVAPDSFGSLLKNYDLDVLASKDFQIYMKPFIIPDPVASTNDFKDSIVDLVVHNRYDNSISELRLEMKMNSNSQTDFKNLNTLQGHTKSIRKLVKSDSSGNGEVLLSLSNFNRYNYLWEPLKRDDSLFIHRKFKIDIGEAKTGEAEGIWTAFIINDINAPNGEARHHITITIERRGVVSVWDCDEQNTIDWIAKPMKRLEIVDKDGEIKYEKPLCSILKQYPRGPNTYCLVLIYGIGEVIAWKLRFENNKATLTSHFADSLPNSQDTIWAEVFDYSISHSKDTSIMTLDKGGILKSMEMIFNTDKDSISWTSKSVLFTGIQNAWKMKGSFYINKVAIIGNGGYNLSIWDLNSSQLEYEETFKEEYGPVTDLDWTFVNSKMKSTSSALLNIGFSRFVLLYSQMRYDYTNNVPAYALLKRIDVSDHTSHEIGDSIWIGDSYLVIGCGNQLFIDDKGVKLGTNNYIDSTIRQLMVGYETEDKKHGDGGKEIIYDIEYLVRSLNGPLPVYHPQFLIQGLFLNQINFVKDILVKLFHDLRKQDFVHWDLGINTESWIFSDECYSKRGMSSVFRDNSADILNFNSKEEDAIFSRCDSNLAGILIDMLTKISLPLLTRHQQITLVSIISVMRDFDKFESSLDSDGIRFWLGFMLFQRSSKQKQLTMRDICWAVHSERKEILLSLVKEHYKNKMTWLQMKQAGISYWLDDMRLAQEVEESARNTFSSSRDPSGIISLLYLALGKKKLLIGLWKTVSHSERQKMLKFLNNDFTQERWRSAALKNAFVLLGKHRYIDSASFFLLGGGVKDCCSILANKVDDVQLAIAVSKIYGHQHNVDDETKNTGMTSIIESCVIPSLLQSGDKWTASWLFMEIGRTDLSFQALTRPPVQMLYDNRELFSEVCKKNYLGNIFVTKDTQSFLNADPALLAFFDTLRYSKKNGEKRSEIHPEDEYLLVKRVCATYLRMGCDYLALYVVKNWVFGDIINIAPNQTVESDATITEKLVTDDIEVPIAPFSPSNGTKKVSTIDLEAPPPSQFVEPDMSSFDFGF